MPSTDSANPANPQPQPPVEADPIEALDIDRERKDTLYAIRARCLREEAEEERAEAERAERAETVSWGREPPVPRRRRGSIRVTLKRAARPEPGCVECNQPLPPTSGGPRRVCDECCLASGDASLGQDRPYGLRGAPGEVAVVRMVFRGLAHPTGSYSAVLEALAKAGLRTARGERFTPVVLRGIVLRDCYRKLVGNVVVNKARLRLRTGPDHADRTDP